MFTEYRFLMSLFFVISFTGLLWLSSQEQYKDDKKQHAITAAMLIAILILGSIIEIVCMTPLALCK